MKGNVEQSEMGLSREDLIQRGAPDQIQKGIAVEAHELLAGYGNVVTLHGQMAVVRNGYLPAWEVLTSFGNVEVKVPKVRDRSGSGVKFKSVLVPPLVRRSPRIWAALPWLDLKGMLTGDMRETLAVPVGEQVKGLSANLVPLLKADWAAEYVGWVNRDLSSHRYVYRLADGIHTGLCQEDDAKACLLAIIGVTPERCKELLTMGDGPRESKEPWFDVLPDLMAQRQGRGPLLAVDDHGLGFWAALDEFFPETRRQCCCVHKTASVLNALLKSLQAKGKADLHEIWMVRTRAQAMATFEQFLKTCRTEYPKAVDKFTRDRDALPAFCDFPADHWTHLRTTNPIESTFATGL